MHFSGKCAPKSAAYSEKHWSQLRMSGTSLLRLWEDSPSLSALCLTMSILSCSKSAIFTKCLWTIFLTNFGGTTGSASPKMNGDVSYALLLVPLRLPHSPGNTPGGGPGELLKVPRSSCLTSSGSSGTPSPPPTNDNTTMVWVPCHSPFHTNY